MLALLLLRSVSNSSDWNVSSAQAGPEQAVDRWWGCPSGGHALKISIIMVLGCLIIVGNSFVLMVIASSVSGWSSNSRYILISLTGTDVTLALVVVPLNLYGSLVLEPSGEDDEESPLGPYCHIVAFLNAAVFASSIYSLTTISLERYVAVFFPLHYDRLMSRCRVKLLIAAAWLLPPIFLFPIAIPGETVIRVYFSRESLICNPDYASNVTYSVLLTTVIFFPCSTIVTFANLRLWLVARRQRRRFSVGWVGGGRGSCLPAGCRTLAGSRVAVTNGGLCITREIGDRGLPSEPGSQRRLKGDAASRVLVPVVIVFYTCWAPCMVTILYNGETSLYGSVYI
ncbi:D(4) dopamine receptor-like [Ascaphus truei]|uniref:D(4) dopamine receptor-like n=1 Tax=Ascaphus truei TaxID=8439 RepID=UPI003F5AA0A2